MKRLEITGTPIAGAILLLTGLHMAAAAVTFALWRMTGNEAWVSLFFKYQGSLFFIACAALELWLAWSAFRQFSRGEALRTAWLLIAIGSFYRLAGFLFSQVLGVESYLNPIFVAFGPLNPSFSSACRNFGLLVGGPLQMAALAAGLFLVLRVLARLGMLARLRLPDFILIAGMTAFVLRQAYEFAAWLRTAPVPNDFPRLLSWAVDPFLCVLLLEAILIRRSAIDAGWGLLARSWRAFAVGIFLTLLGNIGLWAGDQGYLTWPFNSVTWYVWFLASAAYALAPAYQVEAHRRTVRDAAILTE